MHAVVEQGKQVIGNYAFERVVVCETQADPQAVELGATEKGFALGLKVVVELSDEIDGANFGERDLLVLAFGSKNVNRVRLTEACGTKIAAKGCLVQVDHNDFLVRRGWGSGFQRIRTWKGLNLRKAAMYVMLSAFSLSSHCFY